MRCDKANESAGPVVNSQSSHNFPVRRHHLTAVRSLPALDKPFRSAITGSMALTPNNVGFVDLQWYRKTKEKDSFLKSVYCDTKTFKVLYSCLNFEKNNVLQQVSGVTAVY